MIPQHIFNTFCRVATCGSKKHVWFNQNIPPGPKVFASNHSLVFDPLYVYHLLGRPTCLAGQMLFDVPIVGWVMRGCGFIPVAIHDGDVGRVMAYRQAVDALRSGRSLFVCPEGRLTTLTSFAKAKTGAVRIALDAQVPIIPIGIRHQGKIYSRTIAAGGHYDCFKFMLRGHTYIRFGEPFWPNANQNHRAMTAALMGEIMRLL